MNTAPTPLHQIFLFGALRVSQDGNAVPLSGEKTQSLLAFLVLNPRLPHRREKLADLLYPDAPFERGRRNFSDTLYRLQKAIGSDWFVIDRDTLALRLDEQLWADVWEFERLSASEQEADLQIAITLYTGDLLPELYDDWLIPERELRRNQYLSMLEKLAVAQEGRGDFRQALLTLRRLVSTEPLHEPAHQSYLRVLGHMQRYGEAQTHYDYLQRMLRSELGVEPLAETRFIAETIENERNLATVQTMTVERTPFVGRKAERASALSSVEAALKGKGGILAIEGAAGIGKSRMLSEIAAGIRWRGAIFLQGTASETPGASPFSPLADALAPLINSPRGLQLETLLADETMAALAALNSPWADKVELAEVPPEMAVNRFYDALRLLGETLARLSPTVVAFDDLQWADTALWKSVEALAQGLTRGGALLIVIYRRPEIERSQGWEVLQAWDRAGLLNTILLQPLSVEEVAQLIADTPQADPLEMHAWTGGNPFYISEWLAAPESNKPTRQNPITNRLPSLSQTARLALESASILGKNVPYRLWAEISAMPPLTLAGLSDELAAHHWLQPSTSGYTFTHDLVRDEVFNQIESSRRSEMHARAARAYQVFEPENLRARAFHLDKAGQIPEAAHVFRLASQQDQARFAFAEAQHALDRALLLLPPASTQERVETDLEMVGLCSITGDLQRQASALKDALNGAPGLGNDHLLYKTLLAAGRVADDAGKIEGAEAYYEAALALARKMGDQKREGEILYWSTVLVAHQGRWRQAQELAEQALVQARAGGDRYIEGKALRAIGIIKSEMEQPAEAILWLEKSAQIFGAIGRNYDMWVSQLNLMTMYSELGIWDRSLETARELIAKLDASGARVRGSNVRLNLVDVHLATGNFSAARQVIEEIPDNGSSLGARGVAVVKNNLALVAEMQGSYAEAEQLYLDGLKVAEASKAFDLVASAQHNLGVMLVHLDTLKEAIAHLESALALQQEEGDLLDRLKSEAFLGLALVKSGGRSRAEDLATSGWIAFQAGVPIGDKYQNWLWALFRLLQELGRLSQANELLQAAHDELQRQAQYIADPTLRRGFFDLVYINRAIVEAYDRSHRISRVRSVRLASKHAPLGRLLRQDEYVAVQWTVSAPEDEAITDKTARRHIQLKRLLTQAESQNAAPTDDDLAQALGVSRRTILRDMQALAQEIPRPPTRKRKV
jgi:DNA-binding SARP family transcriptional activator